eukprot:387919_1
MKEAFKQLARRASVSTNSPDVLEPISDEISVLYENVRKSHALYQLGLDEDGQDLKHKRTYFKCIPKLTNQKCDLFSKCKQSKMDPRLFRDSRKQSGSMIRASKRRRSTRTHRRASNLQSYKARKDKFSQNYAKLVKDPTYKIISMFISVGALYTRDIVYAMIPKQGDFFSLDIILSIIFFWLFVELVLYSLTHSNYCFTFFFWLDLVGTASILIDIPWIMFGIGFNNSIFLIVKGGRMGRAARGAGSVRFIKLIKMIRMVKLFRIVQLFRKKKSKDDDTTSDSAVNSMISNTPKSEKQFGDDDNEIKPTKMGSLLADRVTQKVILGVLLSFLILPIFDVGKLDQGEKTFIALEDLEYIYTNHHNTTNGYLLASHSTDYDNSLNRFGSYHTDAKILYLKVKSSIDDFYRVEIDSPNNNLRIEERAEFYTDSTQSFTILNVRSNVQEEAILNICLTTFIMSIFAIGSFVISVDAFMLVYPLEYLVIVLKRLSSIAVHMYQETSVEPNGDNQGNVTQNDLFGSIMQSMTDIFYSGKREKLFINSLENIPTLKPYQDSSDSSVPPTDKKSDEDKPSIELVPVTSHKCITIEEIQEKEQ